MTVITIKKENDLQLNNIMEKRKNNVVLKNNRHDKTKTLEPHIVKHLTLDRHSIL